MSHITAFHGLPQSPYEPVGFTTRSSQTASTLDNCATITGRVGFNGGCMLITIESARYKVKFVYIDKSINARKERNLHRQSLHMAADKPVVV